ncbi:MAG: hypothetical protein ACP5R5_00565 [Armatimonadota bacterium]
MPRKLLVLLVAEVFVLIASYLWASYRIAHGFGFPLDDSWIYAVFARNLAEGRGLVYNPGQPASPTGILYGLMLGGLYSVAVAPVTMAVVSGFLLHLGTTMLVYSTARHLELGRGPSAVCALVFAGIPRLVWGAMSGMEVSLYVFLVTLGIYWQVHYRWYEGSRAYFATGAFALAALTRPECGAFLAASIVERLVTSHRFDTDRGGAAAYARTIPLHLALFAAIIAPAVAFNMWATGLPLPPAFYAKSTRPVEPGLVALVQDCVGCALQYLGQALQVSGRDNALLPYAAIAGIALIWKWSSTRSRASALILPLGFLIVPSATGILASTGRGSQQLIFQTGRYSAYLVPLTVLLAAAAFDLARPLLKKQLAQLAGIAFLAAGAWFLVIDNIDGAIKYGSDVRCINSMQVVIGKWAARLPQGTVLAVNDAGAIPYFSRKRILDTVGVTNPEVIPYLRKYRIKQPGLMEYLVAKRPDYLIIFPRWYPRIAARTDILHPVKVVKLRHNTICGGSVMVVYKPSWKQVAPTKTVRPALKATLCIRRA